MRTGLGRFRRAVAARRRRRPLRPPHPDEDRVERARLDLAAADDRLRAARRLSRAAPALGALIHVQRARLRGTSTSARGAADVLPDSLHATTGSGLKNSLIRRAFTGLRASPLALGRPRRGLPMDRKWLPEKRPPRTPTLLFPGGRGWFFAEGKGGGGAL